MRPVPNIHRVFREKEYLIREYIQARRSTPDIAREHGVAPASIIHWLRKHEIPRRSTSETRQIKHWRGPCKLTHFKKRAMTAEERLEYRRLVRLAFPEKFDRQRVVGRQWCIDNAAQYKEAHRRYRRNNLHKYRGYDRARQPQKTAYTRERRSTNFNFKIRCNLAGRINAALRGKNKSTSTLKLLGCSIESFRLYLESKFEPNMTWENYGRYPGWQIDHIMPCAIFDLTKSEHQRRCFHFSNMQPMWAADNISKNGRPVTDQFQLL